MPEYRLVENTRPWPGANYVSLYIATGTFNTNSNGVIQPSANTAEIFLRDKVKRKRARKGSWRRTPSSFILSNWDDPSVELRIAVSTFKRRSSFRITGQVGVDTSNDNVFSANASASFTFPPSGDPEDDFRSHFNVPLDRCATLANIVTDRGQGTRNGFRVYRFGSMEFYLDITPQVD